MYRIVTISDAKLQEQDGIRRVQDFQKGGLVYDDGTGLEASLFSREGRKAPKRLLCHRSKALETRSELRLRQKWRMNVDEIFSPINIARG